MPDLSRFVCRLITLAFVASPFVLVTVAGGWLDLLALLGGIAGGLIVLLAIKGSGWV